MKTQRATSAVTKILNVALPPLSLILLIIFMLPLLLFKFLMYVKKLLYTENVANKVVLITGAAAGIGEQIAYEYARRGAKLSLVDINEDNLVKVANKTRSLGCPDVTTISADVSKVQDCKRFVDETINYFGTLDHLVNNAGISGKLAGVEDWRDASDFTSVMDINFWGAVYGTLYAIPHLKVSKGKIIVLGSGCGWFPVPRISVYNASKAAVINFFETLRIELGSAIGVTIVTPGLVQTDFAWRLRAIEDLLARVPMVSAGECAKAIVESGCKGDMYVTCPSWVRVLFPWKVLFPKLIDWAYGLILGPPQKID